MEACTTRRPLSQLVQRHHRGAVPGGADRTSARAQRARARPQRAALRAEPGPSPGGLPRCSRRPCAPWPPGARTPMPGGTPPRASWTCWPEPAGRSPDEAVLRSGARAGGPGGEVHCERLGKDSCVADCPVEAMGILTARPADSLVVDGARTLLGTVTDGDIRPRAARRAGAGRAVALALNRTPIRADAALSRDEALAMMRAGGCARYPWWTAGRVVGLGGHGPCCAWACATTQWSAWAGGLARACGP